MDGLLLFLSEVWLDFQAKSAVDQLVIALAFLTPIAGLLIWLIRSVTKLGRQKSILAGVTAQRDQYADKMLQLAKRRDKLQARVAELDPKVWLNAAAKEQRDGNEEGAYCALQESLEKIAPALALVSIQLAESYTSILAEDGGALSKSERYARLASLLVPEDRDASLLLENILLASSDKAAVDESDLRRMVHIPSDTESASATLRAIFQYYDKTFAMGAYRICLQLATRAILVCRRSGLTESLQGIHAKYLEAKALKYSGFTDIALKKISTLINIAERVQGREHPDVLAMRFMEAQCIEDMGEYCTALQKATALIDVLERLNGLKHPHVLATRQLEAHCLKNIGRYKESLEKITYLLPIFESVEGPEHPNVLATRDTEAHSLNDLGRHQEALEKIKVLLPMCERTHGPEHPMLLITRCLEVQCLNYMGRYQDALEKIHALLPIIEKVQGPEHPDTLYAQYLHIKSLNDTGAHKIALENITSLLPIIERIKGYNHPQTLRVRWLFSYIMANNNNIEKSLKLLDEILSLLRSKLIEDHRYIRDTHELINKLRPGDLNVSAE